MKLTIRRVSDVQRTARVLQLCGLATQGDHEEEFAAILDVMACFPEVIGLMIPSYLILAKGERERTALFEVIQELADGFQSSSRLRLIQDLDLPTRTPSSFLGEIRRAQALAALNRCEDDLSS